MFWKQSDNSNGFVSFMKLVFTFKGDQEKIKIGYVQNPIMDRDKVNELPESQVHTSYPGLIRLTALHVISTIKMSVDDPSMYKTPTHLQK